MHNIQKSRNIITQSMLILFLLTNCIFARTGGNVDFICPIDANKFSAYQDFSGTSFGARLDLKRVGPIAQPSALPDCPKCHFIIFDANASKDSIGSLRPFITGADYQRSGKKVSYYRLAIIKEFPKDSPYEIGFSYLKASWQTEKDPKEYSDCIKNALKNFLKASSEFANQKDKQDEYLISCYLPIEILRRTSRFNEAKQAISDFPKNDQTKIEWLKDVIAYQRKLIEKMDSSEHLISDAL